MGLCAPSFDKVGNVQSLLDIGRGRPRRPLFLATDLGDAVKRQRLFADDHAIADRPVVGQDIVEIARVAIDHDRARRFLAVILDNCALVRGRNVCLRVRRIGEQFLVALSEVGFR
jgi:hypothetical protein